MIHYNWFPYSVLAAPPPQIITPPVAPAIGWLQQWGTPHRRSSPVSTYKSESFIPISTTPLATAPIGWLARFNEPIRLKPRIIPPSFFRWDGVPVVVPPPPVGWLQELTRPKLREYRNWHYPYEFRRNTPPPAPPAIPGFGWFGALNEPRRRRVRRLYFETVGYTEFPVPPGPMWLYPVNSLPAETWGGTSQGTAPSWAAPAGASSPTWSDQSGSSQGGTVDPWKQPEP